MGFECSLAIVLPTPSVAIVDFYPPTKNGGGDREDIFFDNKIRVIVPAREWKVFRFTDFGRVRAITKSSSSLSPSERASGSSSSRAAKCAASHLMTNFFQCEIAATQNNPDYVVPFIADHLLCARNLIDCDDFNYAHRFKDIFARLSSHDVVTGLWSANESYVDRYASPRIDTICAGMFWEYNKRLISEHSPSAVTMAGLLQPPCGLVWESANNVARWLSDLLCAKNDEGTEVRKDELSIAIVCTWRDALMTLSTFGARVIFLSGSFHSEASSAMRGQRRTL